MDFQRHCLSWLLGLSILLSVITESQFAIMRHGSSKKSSPLPRRFQINKIPPKFRPTPVAPPKTETVTRPPVYRGIAVKCHADSMEVVVRADLFDTGLLIEAQRLHLGSNDCTAFPSAEAELTVHFNLMDCGMKLSVSVGSRPIYSSGVSSSQKT